MESNFISKKVTATI